MSNNSDYNLKLGSHIGFVAPKYFLGSVQEALSFKENAFMFYTGAPQNTKRIPFERFNFEAGKELWESNGFQVSDIIVHCPYIVNPATPDLDKQVFTIDFLVQDIKRLHQMGIKYYVLHPGKYMDSDLITGIKNCAYVINQVIKLTNDTDVVICLETMAGLGTEIAAKFINLADIIHQIKEQKRIGVCIDTCHIWDAGYDIKDPDNVLKEFDDAVGLKYLKCMHINDSKNKLGCKKDRHQNIGYGEIGFDTLVKWIFHKDTNRVIKVLETPYVNGKAPYGIEISMLKSKKFIDWINNENNLKID